MNNKLKEKFSEIQRMKNTNMLDSKKNLKIEIVFSVALAIILGAVYYFYRRWEILVCAILVPTAMTAFCIYAYFKEKRQDKSSGKDMQAFISGEKYRKKDYKTYSCYRIFYHILFTRPLYLT